jgi:STE24 endopeptidase
VFALAQPVIGWRVRQLERQADRRGLVLTGNPEAHIRLQVRLARRNRTELRPPAWVRWWLSSHPSVYERIGTARWYAGWLRKRK